MSCNYSLHRDRGQVLPQCHKTAVKFQRIRCTKCFTSPKNNQKKEYHSCKTCACLNPCVCCNATDMTKAASVKRSFWMFGTASLCRNAFHGVHKGQPEQRESPKTVDNSKAICCTILKWITELKCVNSEVKSVDIHPEKGCLNWPYGTMSESP